MSDFFVGQKVVRAGPGVASADETTEPCVLGAVYTVRWVGVADFQREGVVPALRIAERTRTFSGGRSQDYPYCAKLFRPVESKAISLFRKIARDVTEGRKVEFVE